MHEVSSSESREALTVALQKLRAHMERVAELIEDGAELAYQERCVAKPEKDNVFDAETDYSRALLMLPPKCVDLLLKYLPTTAGPWKVTDMRAGLPIGKAREGYGGESIARVKLKGKEWLAWVGDAFVECPDDYHGYTGSIGWPSDVEAIRACDDRLIEENVMFLEEES